MVEWAAISVATMACAVIAQHLGLTDAVAEVVAKIASCPKCASFWATLAVLSLLGANIVVAVSLSVLMSYLSHYFGLVLVAMQKIYDMLWERVNR